MTHAPSADKDSAVTELWSAAPLTVVDRSSITIWLRRLQQVTTPTTALVGVTLAEDKQDNPDQWVFCPILRVDDLGPVRDNDGAREHGRRTLKRATVLVPLVAAAAMLSARQPRWGRMYVGNVRLVEPHPQHAAACAQTRCGGCPLWFNCVGGHMPVASITRIDIAHFHLQKRCTNPSTGAWAGAGTAVSSIGVSIKDTPGPVPSRHRTHWLPHFIKD